MIDWFKSNRELRSAKPLEWADVEAGVNPGTCRAWLARYAFLINTAACEFDGARVIVAPGHKVDEVVQQIDTGIDYFYGGLGI